MARALGNLTRFGLPDSSQIRADLARAGILDESGAVLAPDVLTALGRAGDPGLATRSLAALISSVGDHAPIHAALATDAAFRARLVGLLGASEPLAEHVAAHPTAWLRIADGSTSTGPLQSVIRAADGVVLPPDAAIAALRIEYRTQVAALAGADVAPAVDPNVAGPSVATVGRTLAALADAVLDAALSVAEHAHPSAGYIPLSVVAMGKCGAGELNYLSDVDVLFVVADSIDAPGLCVATARAIELMRICRLVAWEVDAALRPEGKAGPLVRTLGGYRAYYEKWAKTWEFQALLKARAAVGDPALGREFLDVAQSLVWSAANRPDFVSEVQTMRRRVAASVPVAARDTELKLSAGGLRDVEFAVQLLQLVHGRVDETLRVPGTLSALAALTAGGYVGRSDGADLAAAYTLERRVEHRAQLQRLRRTHSLPAQHAELQWLARTAGMFGGDGGVDAAGQLTAEIARHGATVRRLHEKLFYRPLLTAVAAVPTDELRLTSEAATSRLAALGFDGGLSALRHIQALTGGVSRRAAIQRTLLPMLLDTFATAPDPDAGLLGYRTVSDALAETPWYLRLLRDEGVVAERLAGLLGTSRLVADLLQRAPEVLRLLADDTALAGVDPAEEARQAAIALGARAERARTAETAAVAARSARRHEMLRLACADLRGLLDSAAVMSGLTSIADAAVAAALAAAHRQVFAQRYEQLSVDFRSSSDGGGAVGVLAATVVVIAMGRFGGFEMGYSSDADVLFVAAPASPAADPRQVVADATAIAEITTSLLGRPSPDPALMVDSDLRPGGRSGPLVRTVESYSQYWQRHIEPWQRQALLRARPIWAAGVSGGVSGGASGGASGDASAVAVAEFMAVIDPLRYPEGGLAAADAREIRRIKARVDTERLPRRADRTLHTKLGSGGLADVEWAVQLLQLQHAGAVPALRTTGTLTAIAAASDAGLIDPAAGQALIEGWAMATRARNAIMLVTGRPGDEIPSHGRQLAGIARACGYSAEVEPGQFIDDYRRATRHSRHAVERLFDQG